MRAILVHLSGLAGVIVFLNRLWTGVSIEETISAGAIAGLTVYLVLLLLDMSIQHILTQASVGAAAEGGDGGGKAKEGSEAPEPTPSTAS